MASWSDDPRCQFNLKWDQASLVVLKAALDPDNLMHSGCRVIKHPDCCVLCALNDDCDRLPIHVRCRCVAERYLGTADHFSELL